MVGKGKSNMMYIHYCENCETIFILNGHKQECPKCAGMICELKITFEEYSALLPTNRELLRRRLTDADFRNRNITHYRFAKHTKRFQKSGEKTAGE